jgi:hypothetical protein
MTHADREQARHRLTTTSKTAGVRVRMKPEGLQRLAERGDVAMLRQQIPMLEADQHAQLLQLLTPAVRRELQDVAPASPRPRRVGRPPKAPAEDSPIARAMARANGGRGMTKREVARALGVGDAAVGNAEARGLAAAPPTIAKYLAPTGARLSLVVTHADGTEERFPVEPDAA